MLRRLGIGRRGAAQQGMTANELFAAQQQALNQQFNGRPVPNGAVQAHHPGPPQAAWPQYPPPAPGYPRPDAYQQPSQPPPQGGSAWHHTPSGVPQQAEPALPAEPAAPAEAPGQGESGGATAPVAVGGEQASVKLVTSTLAGLAMRDLALVDSLIEVVEDLEDSSEDPELLDSLFKIDNLATRMRRNSENLLVLADQDTGDPSAEPVPMLDVARAAISEIKDYQRVQVGRLPQVFVAGTAADDLSHLLAELMDNATGKSPEHAQVVVSGQYMVDGERLLITVQDEGIGIPDDQITDLNERLRGEPVLDEQVMRHMGLYVVSNIAHRHGMEVQLEARAFRGISAHVVVGSGLVSKTGPQPSAPAPAPPPLPAAPPAPRRSAPESPRAAAPVQNAQEERSAMDSSSSVTPAGLPRRSAHRTTSPMPVAETWDSEEQAERAEEAESADRAERIRDDLAGFVEGEEAARGDEDA
ncbi:sensor histidine kinase [Streptomonospora wellingtoniae]|uniref:histidine kinase n=1 Tax=Streptomonospora wellingtoniae TaxID=3075544 RepID=A0ABU2KRF7_9ACTN|nr:ATP-binding protein [Streptomonospora sp. DSM 45055]MDT0301703.1 ATP-binding protein [Streptomonospora sp. DSM 45055]